MTELYVVPGDRQVERLARDGKRAETRASLRDRLTAALLPNVAFADRTTCRFVLGMALGEPATRTRQMDLFGPQAVRPGDDDPLLAAVRRRGGESWARVVFALDEAISTLRGRCATSVHLQRVADRGSGVLAARARTIATAMVALDEYLARGGLVDGRLLGPRLAGAIESAPAGAVLTAVNARRLRARWILVWEPADLAWWRALDDRLSPAGGWARVALPSFERPLEGDRDRDPLEVLAEEVARGLDGAPEAEPVAAVLGDLTGTTATVAASDLGRVRLVRAADPAGQARAAAREVAEALDRGAAVERVVIAVPMLEERTVGPLRRALDEAAIVTHESKGAPASAAPVITAALHALDAAETFERAAVARLLRSGYVDGSRLVTDLEPRAAQRALGRIARILETAPTAAGADAAERLVRTAAASDAADAPVLAALVRVLKRSVPRTRLESTAYCRALWADLGFAMRAGRGGLSAFVRDEAPEGVLRAERAAIARDARAWDALNSALSTYEQIARAMNVRDEVVGRAVFRAELLDLLDSAVFQPGAGRAAAVRIARLAELAGEDLDALIVLDANDGMLPRDEPQDALVSDALSAALGRASRGAFVPAPPAERRSRDLAALAVSAADARSVVLISAREDGAGAPLEPSFIVDALSRAGARIDVATLDPPTPATGHTAKRAAKERERESFFFDPERPRSEVVGDLTGSVSALGVRGVLAAATGGAGRAISVTALERFARCPFMGLAHVVLGAREPEEREELPDAREEGTLVHDALAKAFAATAELWQRRPRDEAAILERGLSAAEEVLGASSGHAPLRAVVQLRVRDAVRAVLLAAVTDTAWNFVLAEQAFGAMRSGEAEPHPWPEYEIRDAEGEILALRGKIDRVDVSPDGSAARVVDYKRSKTAVRDATAALGDTALQVPLYARVVSRRLAVPTSGTYLAFQPRDISERRHSAKLDEAMAALVTAADGALPAVERRALAVVTSARRGLLAPLPSAESVCRTCAVSGGCRKPRFAMAPAEDAEDN